MASLNDKVSALIKKSRENYGCAVVAHNKSYFNSAISRYYYSCYLLAKCFAYKNGWLTDTDFNDKTRSSHTLVQKEFIDRQIKQPGIELADIAALRYFTSIKSARQNAEYSYDHDYSNAGKKSEYESCKFNAKTFISAIENIYKVTIIEEVDNE